MIYAGPVKFMRSGIHPDGAGDTAKAQSRLTKRGPAWDCCYACKKCRPASTDCLEASDVAQTNPTPSPYR